MTDYERTIHLRLMLTVAEETLAKIGWSPAFGGLDPNQTQARQALSTLEKMRKIMEENS